MAKQFNEQRLLDQQPDYNTDETPSLQSGEGCFELECDLSKAAKK